MTSPANKKQKQNTTYRHYKLSRDGSSKIDIIKLDDDHVTAKWFYEHYINPRKPAIIKYKKGYSEKFKVDVDAFKPDRIGETLKSCNNDNQEEDDDEEEEEGNCEELLQVEELHNGGFGSGKTRLQMTFSEFLARVKKGESLYLTTQYEENDPRAKVQDDRDLKTSDDEEEKDGDDEDEDDESTGLGFGSFQGSTSDDEFGDVHDDFDDFDEDDDADADEEEGEEEELNRIYQAPLTPMLASGSLPPHPFALTETLVPQQINLWFGRTPNDTEQLKIDYEDNNETIKNINKGLPTINSTSTGLHHDHADNLYVLVKGKKRFTLFSPDYAPNLYTTGDVRKIYDTGVIDYVMNEKAKNWTTVLADGSVDPEVEMKCVSGSDTERQDPPSFCQIPPALLHIEDASKQHQSQLENFSRSHYPSFNNVKNAAVQVFLEDGDLLYLPAGWFHEVTSFGDEKSDNTHIAINYWFIPPDGESFENPYTNETWSNEFSAWKNVHGV